MNQSRRQFMMATGNAGVLSIISGCTSGTQFEPDSGPKVEITQSDIVSDEQGDSWIITECQNSTESDHGRVRLSHSVYDARDDLVDTQEATIDMIPAGERWLAYRSVLGDRRDDAEYVESQLITEEDRLEASKLEGIRVIDSTLNQDFQTGTEIVGEIENRNNQKYSQVYLVGLVYNDKEILRGSVGEILRDVGPNETRAFRAAIAGNRTPENRENHLPTQHEIHGFDGIP